MPQTSVDPSVLCTATEAVSDACKLRGIIGHFSIDFVTFIDPKSVSTLWCTVDNFFMLRLPNMKQRKQYYSITKLMTTLDVPRVTDTVSMFYAQPLGYRVCNVPWCYGEIGIVKKIF